MRRNGWRSDIIFKYSVIEKPKKWTFEKCYQIAKNFSKLKDFKKEVKVIGNDFLEENKEWMREGVINFLIGQNSYVQGYEPVMILFRLLLDHEFPKEERQYTEIVIKNKYNL